MVVKPTQQTTFPKRDASQGRALVCSYAGVLDSSKREVQPMAIIEKEIKLVGSKGEHELVGLFDSGATYLEAYLRRMQDGA